MIFNEQSGKIVEKHELIKKLDSKYENESDREKDLIRLNELTQEINNEVFSNLKKERKQISKIEVTSKIKTVKDLRKEFTTKYNNLVMHKRKVNDYVELLREESKHGRELQERLRGLSGSKELNTKQLKQLKEDILKW